MSNAARQDCMNTKTSTRCGLVALGAMLAVLGLLGVSQRVRAQSNPLLGTWKLDVAKSTFESGQPLKSQTRTYESSGNGQRARIESVDATGSRIVYGYTAGFDGKYYPMSGAGMPGGADSIALARINANVTGATLRKAGANVMTATLTVSQDGKILTISRTGTASAVLVFEKQ